MAEPIKAEGGDRYDRITKYADHVTARATKMRKEPPVIKG